MIYPRGDFQPKACSECHGTGYVFDWEGTFEEKCPDCNGTGLVSIPRLRTIVVILTVSLTLTAIICLAR